MRRVVLSSWWHDPDFDPTPWAFYYARVLQISSPRWTTYNTAYFGVEMPEGTKKTVQNSAYTPPEPAIETSQPSEHWADGTSYELS
ncbi:DUF3604 domain-containing protein [Halovulum sp. GXIMD14794]